MFFAVPAHHEAIDEPDFVANHFRFQSATGRTLRFNVAEDIAPTMDRFPGPVMVAGARVQSNKQTGD